MDYVSKLQTTSAYTTVAEKLNNALQVIEKNKKPVYDAIQSFFTNPSAWFEVLFDVVYTKNKETAQATSEELQKVVQSFLDKNDINISTIMMFVSFFLILSISFIFFETLFGTKKQNFQLQIYNGTMFKYIYYLVWAFVFVFGFCSFNFKQIFQSITFEFVKRSFFIFFTCAAVAISLFLLFSLIIATLPHSAIIFPLIVFIGLLIPKIYFNVGITSFYALVALSVLLFSLLFVLAVVKCFKGFVINFKKNFTHVVAVCPYLFLVFGISSLFQYFQILCVDSISKSTISESKFQFQFLFIFLLAWSYFSCSYFNRLFTPSLLNNYYSCYYYEGKVNVSKSFSESLEKTFKAFNYLAFSSSIPAFLESVNSILFNLYISMNNSGFFIIRLFSYLVLMVFNIFKTLTFIIDSKFSVSLHQLGMEGANAFRVNDNGARKRSEFKKMPLKEQVKICFFSIFDLQAVLFMGMSFLYFTSYGLYLEKYNSLIFPLFFWVNMLIYFTNALTTCYLIRKEHESRKRASAKLSVVQHF